MKSSNKLEMEEQITSMLEKMMREEFDDNMNKTIDTSYEVFEGRKIGKKSMSHQINQAQIFHKNNIIGRLNNQFVGIRDKMPRISNTVTYGNHMNPLNIFVANSPYFHQQHCNNNHNAQILRNQFPFNYVTNTMYCKPIIDNDRINLSDNIYSELERVLAINDKIDERLYKSIRENFINIIRTQNGSRIFQKYLKNTSVNIIRVIFMDLKDNFKFLITDLYANYFCQKLFCYLEKRERIIFLKEVDYFNLD
jgi:hypothetical protein